MAVTTDLSQANTIVDLSPALIAALAAIATALISATIALLVSHSSRRTGERRRRIDFHLRQLNELYGPLYLYRHTANLLREQIGPNDGTWRLVDNISAIADDAYRSTLVEQLIDLNERISDLIVGHAGLLEDFPPPRTLVQFLAHERLLKLSWQCRANQDPSHRFPFPREFDSSILDGIGRIHDELRDLRLPMPKDR